MTAEGPLRLNRFLAGAGLGSRRRADELIAAGKVFVNGMQVTRLGTHVTPGLDTVAYRGKVLQSVQSLEYCACYKPRGVVITAADPQGRPTIYDVLHEAHGVRFDHLRYVGRLDFDSEGLLLLTNDGSLIHAVTHPRFHVKKVYRVRCSRALESRESEMLLKGVTSEGQLLKAGRIAPASPGDKNGYWYEVTLYEGKNRQIRRLFNAVGIDVLRLVRVQFGSVRLGELATRGYRHLNEREIGGLRNAGHPVRR